jgi:hypothetical protein
MMRLTGEGFAMGWPTPECPVGRCAAPRSSLVDTTDVGAYDPVRDP